ncbi:phytoene desaturase family protein [Marinactinospora thermotolerans]|uniref:Phytoene dehydrogenase-related protein n=2 Tax=Marinactinospora thermotolerans TaxID=531310 RepID=A0A1T4SM19_9ACTN|nr:NAD(P)/FAD-dependent oxidoreductase [Marinactinospora thermotolerans]SKA29203.1 Phytoene dehydrogenase-related protein [Marinactinospora thermotolerans DSM 45154]
MGDIDAVVVGTGPNGLAAAVTLARAGLKVELYERHDVIGGGLRTVPLFDSDVVHDVCAAVHPMAAASRFFREFDLVARGVDLLRPAVSYAHPLPHGRAALAAADLDATCAGLGEDARRWRRLMAPLVARSGAVVDLLLSDLRRLPADPVAALSFARRVLQHGRGTGPFVTDGARALLAGVAGHVVGALPSLPGAAVALLLGHLAHTDAGWPLPRGGSGVIAEALAADITAHGGVLRTGHEIRDLGDLPPARSVLLDVAPRGFLRLAGDRLPPRYRRALRRFRYAPGVAKADFLVSEPIPWTAREVAGAGTVHLGGTQEQVFRVETATARGRRTDEPFVLLVDPAVTDPSRASGGRRPVWAYAHVPNGDTRDPVDMIRRRIETYAPGFSDTIIASRGVSAAEMEAYNPNYVGGDIASGAMTLRQALIRPTPRIDPYRTPLPGVYLCSASVPPGPGVHAMSGYLAALSALRNDHGVTVPPSLSP